MCNFNDKNMQPWFNTQALITESSNFDTLKRDTWKDSATFDKHLLFDTHCGAVIWIDLGE